MAGEIAVLAELAVLVQCVAYFEGYAGSSQSPRRGRQMVAPGVSLGKTIEFRRVSPLERAKETITIHPAMQKNNLHSEWRTTLVRASEVL